MIKRWPATRSKPVLLLLWFLLFTPVHAQQLLINEFCAANTSVLIDPDFHQFGDWLEIYNPNLSPLNVKGYSLTDDLAEKMKWTFPSGVTIAPHGFLLIFADERDTSGLALHTNFRLKRSGEVIGLFNEQGMLIDSVLYSMQQRNISIGRFPDGASEWQFFQNATPGERNAGEVYLKTEAPVFSLPGGFFSASQTLHLYTNMPGTKIYYTTNCNEPTQQSAELTADISIQSRVGEANYFSEFVTNADPEAWLPEWTAPASEVFKATVVRARAYRLGYAPSEIVTQTYFIDQNMKNRYPTLAVISLVSDFKNLFDPASGIYVPGKTHRPGVTRSGNYFQSWEKPAHVEFFEPGGKIGFSQDLGIKVQGGTSQVSPQKGLHLIARYIYGDNRINYPVFKNRRTKAKDLTVFKRFIIRAWGSVITAGLFNDAYAQLLMAESGLDLNAYRPAILFINGEYWGLHELREANKNSWYYQFHYGIDRDNPGLDMIAPRGNALPAVDEGDAAHWNAMLDFLRTQDMRLPANYDYIKTQMDIDNFIAYVGHGIYLCKWDWPNNNEACWRPRTATAKWRWTVYDMETSFGVATILSPLYAFLGAPYNMLAHTIDGTPIPGFGQYGPHPVLVRLLQNDAFKKAFVGWFMRQMETTFSPQKMNDLLDEMVAEISPYYEEYRQRWPFLPALNGEWQVHLQRIRDFNLARPQYMRRHLEERFGDILAVADRNNHGQPEVVLMQNYPNPFSAQTRIRYKIQQESTVELQVFNLLGQKVATVFSGRQAAGLHTVRWDARGKATGLYYIRLQCGDVVLMKKMIVLL